MNESAVMFDQSDQSGQEQDAILQLAQTLMQYGQPERALALLALSDYLLPGNQRAAKLRVHALVQAGRWADAHRLILSGEQLAPERRRELAFIYWNLGLAAKGDKAYREALGTA